MPAPIVVDAGPLIALCDPQDTAHMRCALALQQLPRSVPLVTSLAPVMEAMHLLRQVTGGRERLIALLTSGSLQIDPTPTQSLRRIGDIMARYASLPGDFADAAVVELAERLGATTIFTLDERDFRVYEPRHTPHFRLLPADL